MNMRFIARLSCFCIGRFSSCCLFAEWHHQEAQNVNTKRKH